MALLAPIRELRSAPIPLSSGDPALIEMFGGSSVANSSMNVNTNSALTVSTVYACVNRKAKTLAMLPLNVMRKLPNGGKEIALNHRCQRQLSAQPNRWQTSYDWRLYMHTQLMLRGNAYSYIMYNPGRKINELVPMDADRVWPFVITPNKAIYYLSDASPAPPAGSALWYHYFPMNASSMILEAGEVLHIKGMSTNGIVGKNVVKLMRESIGLAMATEEQGARLFSNGAQIGKIFTHPNKLGDDTYARLKNELSQTTTGVGNAHKTIILEDGMSISPTTLTMVDSQFLESRQFQVEDISSALDVPLMLINRSGDKNQTFASAELINQIFVTHMMHPDLVCWEQVLNKDLLYDWERKEYFCSFDFDEMLRGDTKARAEYLTKRFGMASMSPDEVRIYEGENPTGTEEGKKFYLQSGMVPVEMASQVPTKLPETKPQDQGTDNAGNRTPQKNAD